MADGDTTSTMSKMAQDISEQQGTNYSDIATSETNRGTPDYTGYDYQKTQDQLNSTVNFNDSKSYIDTAKDTVAGQLQTLLASNSPYLKQQENLARERAGAAGHANSYLQGLAGREAAINAALPIAQQDAQTNASFSQKLQEADYNKQTMQGEAIISANMTEHQAGIDAINQKIQNSFSAMMAGADAQSQTMITDLQGNWNALIKDMEIANTQFLQGQELSYSQENAVREVNNSLLKNLQVSIENLRMDPDFATSGPAALQNAINGQIDITKNMIRWNLASVGASADIEMMIEDYLATMEIPEDYFPAPEEDE